MADLSFLFSKTQPGGAMAGLESGYGNAQTLANIDHTDVGSAKSLQDMQFSAAKHPYELQKLQLEGAQAQQDMDPEMLAARKQGYLADQGKKGVEWKKALMEMDDAELTRGIQHTVKAMSAVTQGGLQLVQQGVDPLEAMPMLVSRLKPEEQQKIAPAVKAEIQKMQSMSPEQRKAYAIQYLSKADAAIQEHAARMTPEYVKMMAQEGEQRKTAFGVANINAASAANTARIGAQGKESKDAAKNYAVLSRSRDNLLKVISGQTGMPMPDGTFKQFSAMPEETKQMLRAKLATIEMQLNDVGTSMGIPSESTQSVAPQGKPNVIKLD